MAPKNPVEPALSASKHLVPVGHRDVTTKRRGAGRNENGDKPTTARALVLRNGKHGTRGTGEVMLITKISGREKLDLLAEDLVEQTKRAVLEPFRLDKCVKISESQLHAFLDEISNLRDPDVFASQVQAEFKARTSTKQRAGGFDPWKNASYIASLISTRIHNAYMQASAWKIVYESLLELQADGLEDRTAKAQLKNSASLRSRYLVLHDMVNHLVDTSQTKFSVLATTTEHYAPYFKKAVTTDPSDADLFVFEWDRMREACKSFLDSIIIELCLPGATYPKHILYQILHQSVEESPKEAKRFPQALWDAVGDLSVTVELLEILDRPLLGPEGKAWKQLPRQMPEPYEKWVDAQLYSEKAADMFRNYKDIIFPLEKTKNSSNLENMWKYINLNYQSASGVDIDTLWQLDDVLHRTPQWHSYHIPTAGGDSNSDSPPRLTSVSRNKTKPHRKPLAITSGVADDFDSDGSMPELQSVSNSSEEDSDSYSDSDGNDEDDSDGESGYDTEQGDELRDLRREAMDLVSEIPGFFDPKSQIGNDFDALQEERKGNPFLKLLGSLRGRMFSSNPKLKTTNRNQPRDAYVGTKPPPSATATKTPAPHDEIPPLLPIPSVGGSAGTEAEAKSFKATVEEVEDEDDKTPKLPKKKKKKPKKKKKSAPVAPEEHPQYVIDPPGSPTPAKTFTPISQPLHTPAVLSPKKPAQTALKSPTAPARTPSINASAASLALPIEQTAAQSSRSYLQSENISTQKTKVKSRPDHPSLFPISEKTKGFFSKFGGGKDKSKAADHEGEKTGSKHSWFSKLGKKTKGHMHQLLKTSEDDTKGLAPMKWENFLKLMREMGFEYDPSTAGSSVRFDPPDKRDVSITFHRPHPDPTLYPVKLKEFGKKLKRAYGWSEDDFLKQTM